MPSRIDKPIIFIGAPRSGTTIIHASFARHESLGWISNYQNQIPSLKLLSLLNGFFDNRFMYKIGANKNTNEVNKFRLTYPKPTEAYKYWNQFSGYDFGRDFLLNKEANEQVQKNVRNSLEGILKLQGKTRFTDKQTGPPRIQYVKSLFPDAIIVNVVRDGRAVVRSLLNVDFWKSGGGYDKPWWINGEDADLQKIWEANPEPYVLAAVQWRNIVEKARQEKELLGTGQYYEIKYEDFTADPEAEFTKLFDFCELPKSDRVFNYISKNKRIDNRNSKFKKEFSDQQLNTLNEILEAPMNLLGYEL